MPTNGLVVYTGTIMTDDGKEKKVNIDFEPFKPINTSLYLCDNKFHTEALNELLESDNKCGSRPALYPLLAMQRAYHTMLSLSQDRHSALATCLDLPRLSCSARVSPRYGFIIMDGNGSLFGTLCGNTREVS